MFLVHPMIHPYPRSILVFLLYLGAFNVPVLLCVVLDGPIGAEFAHLSCLLDTPSQNVNANRLGWTYLGSRSDALLDPFGTILVSFVYHPQRFDVCQTDRHEVSTYARKRFKRTRVEIVGEQIVISLPNRVQQTIAQT